MRGCSPRIMVLAVLLLAAGTLQLLLLVHVLAADEAEPARPTAPLAEFPRQWDRWRGSDLPVDDQLRFADDSLHRIYRHAETGQQVTLWIAYSAIAADRGHHPEVCMALLGKQQNAQRAETFPVAGHSAPVQQLHFGPPGQEVWVFYWHYALAVEGRVRADRLQRLYRGTRRLAPSVTVQVFSDDQTPAGLAAARGFVQQVDAALQPLVGPGARRGNLRLPVTVVTGG